MISKLTILISGQDHRETLTYGKTLCELVIGAVLCKPHCCPAGIGAIERPLIQLAPVPAMIGFEIAYYRFNCEAYRCIVRPIRSSRRH